MHGTDTMTQRQHMSQRMGAGLITSDTLACVQHAAAQIWIVHEHRHAKCEGDAPSATSRFTSPAGSRIIRGQMQAGRTDVKV